MLSLIEKIFNYFMYGITHQNIPKLRQFSMPKQDKENPTLGIFEIKASGKPASFLGRIQVCRRLKILRKKFQILE